MFYSSIISYHIDQTIYPRHFGLTTVRQNNKTKIFTVPISSYFMNLLHYPLNCKLPTSLANHKSIICFPDKFTSFVYKSQQSANTFFLVNSVLQWYLHLHISLCIYLHDLCVPNRTRKLVLSIQRSIWDSSYK